MNPKVSLCIPAYKQPLFLRKALDSVLAQDFQEYEVIITDDSPDDSVAELVRGYLGDSRFRYHKNEQNLGSPENWNQAVRLACGEYIKILHHDDWFPERGSLGGFVRLLDQNPEADFGFSATIVSSVKNKPRIHAPSQKQLEQLGQDPTMLFYGNVVGAPSATIYRSRVRHGYDVKMKWLVDLDFYARVLMDNNRFAYSGEPLICTTDEAPHQVTSECIDNKEVLLFEHIHLHRKLFHPERYDLRQLRYFYKLFRRLRVNAVQDIYQAGLTAPLPLVVLKALRLRHIFALFGL